MRSPKYILPVIVIAQFFCTALWFAPNGILLELTHAFKLPENSLGHLTTAVQLGFITGTLLFAAFTISDRFSPSKVFFSCAILGASLNLATLWQGNTITSLLIIRFLVGFFLAGIYPVGMKIAADYFKKGLGISLSLLVGALVLGTAFPHCLTAFFSENSWKTIIICTSVTATIGGLVIGLFVPNGPYRMPLQKLKLNSFLKVFKNKSFKQAAFGYFGHMWELYAFWVFVPALLTSYSRLHSSESLNISAWSFIIIAMGSVGCVLGGYFSVKIGAKKIALISLTISGFLCLTSPLLFELPMFIFLPLLLLWGMSVIADSPLFSTLVAHNATPTLKGTSLTIVNCIGFTVSIVTIQLVSFLSEIFPIQYIFMVLAVGPLFGIINAIKK